MQKFENGVLRLLFRKKQLKRLKLINMYLLKADIDSLSQGEDP